MGMNNEGITDRRQLLVKAGSFMKLSWKKSREKLFGQNEDNFNDNSNIRRNGRRRGRNLSARFGDELCVTYFTNDAFLSDEDIENWWYQSVDYIRFKKENILNSLNYMNARRASKPFDNTRNCIWGIEDMCTFNPTLHRRYASEKKHVYKVMREEQARQKKEKQHLLQQKNQSSDTECNANNLSPTYPDMGKFRSVSACHTKGGRDRALARGNEYARVQRSLDFGGTRSASSSMRNLFASFRTQSASISS